jgi:CheY-like chemotaxis protein
MEAIGQLAGGIAHDFNNLLTGILGYAGMLKIDAESGSTVREVAETIEKAAERAAGLIQQLLGFARRGKNQELAVDLHQTIHDVVALLSRTIDKNIRITLDLKAPKTVVMGDPVQLQQILLNLVINSRDAMPDGGDLTFHTDLVELDQDFCRKNPGSKPGSYFLVSVRDTGCGIPKDIQNRIFEPFFTTKEPGHGTGMGLAMVYGTVKNHEGYIQVCSEVKAGTRFNIYLPFTEENALEPGEEDRVVRPVGGKGCLLLVDDEEVVRKVGTAMLGSLGYEILTACNGREAVEVYRERAKEITLVILDMVMPEMGGRECFRALKEINPRVKAILSTGYAKDGKAQETLDEGMAGFIQKPYRMTDISEKVHEALLC